MKISTVATLIMDSQNSDSAKARVELRFEIKTPLAASAAACYESLGKEVIKNLGK